VLWERRGPGSSLLAHASARFATVLLIPLILLSACAGESSDPPPAVLEINAGGVDIQRPGDTGFTPAENGMELALGDRLRPQAGSNAAIIFFEGSVVFLDEGADVTIEQLLGSRDSGQSNLQIFQAAGRTLHRVNKLVDAESSYGVRTSSSIGLVRGTNFIVNDSPDGTNWKSVEGDIGVAGDSGDETVVGDGTSSDVPPEGDPSPPTPDPPTPEEQQQLDDLDTIVEEKAPPPPPQKDPVQSTPVAGPTPTLPPKDVPPPPPPDATAIPTPTNTPPPPAAAPELPGTPTPEPVVGAAPADTPTPAPPPGDTPTPEPDGNGGGEPAATSTPTQPPSVAEGPTATPSAAATPTPVPTPTPLPTVTPLPTITPTPTPTVTPTPTATPTPTLLPTFTPTPTPTPEPTETPVPFPPVPHIDSPGSGATVSAGTVLNISGSGTAAAGLEIDGYSWGYNGAAVSGNSSFTLMVTASGTLTLQVRDSGGTWSDETASVSISVISPTATPTPIPEPTATPEPEPTATPTPVPIAASTPTPTPVPVSAGGGTDIGDAFAALHDGTSVIVDSPASTVTLNGPRTYMVSGTLTVPSGWTFDINAGVTLMFIAGSPARLDVVGTLQTAGTSGSRVRFTSGQASPANGDWVGVYVPGGASATIDLTYTDILYTENGIDARSVASLTADLDNVTISAGSCPLVDNYDQACSGIRVGGTLSGSMSNTTITASGGSSLAFGIWADLSGLTFSGANSVTALAPAGVTTGFSETFPARCQT
jgi:hypothetical protein